MIWQPHTIQNRVSEICTPMFIALSFIQCALLASLFIIARKWRQPIGTPTDEWKKKTGSTHTMEYYSILKKEGN